MAFFIKGEKYSVTARRGLYTNRKGKLAISENNFEKGEVLPEQALTYIGKDDGQHICLLPDGTTQVVVHRNHFDASTKYNEAKRQRASDKEDAAQAQQILREEAAA